MQTKIIKKSELAMYKGFGWLNKQIANKLGVTEKEVVTGMQKFGLIKMREKDAKAYEIQYVNDVTESQFVKDSADSLEELV